MKRVFEVKTASSAKVSGTVADKKNTMNECDKCVEEATVCEHGMCQSCCGCNGEPEYLGEDR